MKEAYLSATEAADFLGVALPTFSKLQHFYQLPYHHGERTNQKLYRRSDLERVKEDRSLQERQEIRLHLHAAAERVRTFIEQAFPGKHVEDVTSVSTVKYREKQEAAADYTLYKSECTFTVMACTHDQTPTDDQNTSCQGITALVILDTDGTLQLGHVTYHVAPSCDNLPQIAPNWMN